MENDSLITPEIQNLLEKETTFTSPEEVGKASIRRFAVAVGDGPHCLDSLKCRISSELSCLWKHQAASANG